MMECLSKPFDPSLVKIKPGQGNQKYIAHPLVTQRLNECDPSWHAEVVEMFHGQNGALAAIRMALTVGGVTRTEVGGPQRNSGILNDLKNAHSDALKRCAMRFGVALGMWGELDDADGDEDYGNGTVKASSSPVERSSISTLPATRATAQNEQGGAKSTAQRTDPVESSGEGYNWQDFWTWARSQKLNSPGAIEAVIGRSINGMTPNQIRDLIVANTADPNATAPPNAAPATISSRQDTKGDDSVLPSQRRQDMIDKIATNTRGDFTVNDLQYLTKENYNKNFPSITIKESRELYGMIMEGKISTGYRDELRRKYAPITDAARKKLFAVVGERSPLPKAEQDNFLHQQLYEHLGLGSVKDMSTYDVDYMVRVYERGDFVDVPQAPDGADGSEPPF